MAICPLIQNLLEVKGQLLQMQQNFDLKQQQLTTINFNTHFQLWLQVMNELKQLMKTISLAKQELAKLEDIHVRVNNGMLPY